MSATILQEWMSYIPSPAVLVSAAALIVGLVLWSSGAKLIRTTCMAASLVLGGLGGFLLARHMGAAGQMIWLWVFPGLCSG